MGSTFKSCYITLLKTSIGSGALSFPYLFSTYGIITTSILTFISGGFAVVGLILYIKCAKEIGRDATISELAKVSMPYTRLLVDFSVFLKCFGVSLSYLIISKQLIPPIINTLFQYKVNPSYVLIIFLLVVGPFCYFDKLDKLKYTSLCGVISILFVILATIYRYRYTTVPDNIITHYTTPISRKYLGGFGKFVFSFTCHQNIFSVHSEIGNNSFKNMRRLIFSVALTALSLYLSFGFFNYKLYGQFVKDNIIMNFPNDILATIVRTLYVMGVSFPLQVTPCRTYLVKLVNIDNKKEKESSVIIISTTLIIILTYLLAISGMNLGLVYSIIGATASTFMCLIFPALFYFNMDIDRKVILDILGYLSFLFGVFVFSTTIYSVVYFKNNKF